MRFKMMAMGGFVFLLAGCSAAGEGERDSLAAARSADAFFDAGQEPLLQDDVAEQTATGGDDDPLGRSDWPTVVVRPMATGLESDAAGLVGGLGVPRAPTGGDDGFAQWQQSRLRAALEGGAAGNLSGANLADAISEPVRLAADVVTLPVSLVTDRPITSAPASISPGSDLGVVSDAAAAPAATP